MKNALLSIASVAILAFVWHTATGASSDDDRANAHAIAINTEGNNTEPMPDFDGDGTVGFGDFVKFAAKFGLSRDDDGYDRQYDLDGDGTIGFSDFLIFASSFGSEAPSPVVSIPDANLRAAIETALEKARGAPITEADLKALTQLQAKNREIRDLTGLEAASNLTWLFLPRNRITNLSALADLTKLERLDLWSNMITDISVLDGLSNLTVLNVSSNMITDIAVLADLPMLRDVSIGGNMITDISVLKGLTNLTGLGLNQANLTDISFLESLTNLTNLDLSYNRFTDLSVLSGLTNLTSLWIENTFANISDISDLAGLTKLERLNLRNNSISDVSVLAGLTDLTDLLLVGSMSLSDITPLAGLTKLKRLWLVGLNNLSDVSPLAAMTSLADLDLEDNYISDLSPLSSLTDMKRLNLKENNVTDISPLTGMNNLAKLDLSYNNLSDISALFELTNLNVLDLRGNPLSLASANEHIPALESRGASIRYDRVRESEFNVQLVFLDAFTERQKRVLRLAARRWTSVIVDDLPDYEFSEGWAGSCGDHPVEISSGERIDDLRIYVISIEDGPLGWGGPDVLRENSHLPLVGCMAFDLARSNLPIIGLHEIGHVLGFGTIWGRLGYYQNPPNGDEHFNGPLAIDAFDDAGGRGYTGAKVPVTGGHWRTSVFGQELMTYGGDLSAITIQSLADLGYSVDVTQADPYTLLNPRASAKIVPAQLSNYLRDADNARTGAHIPGSQNAHERGWNTGAMRTIPGRDRLGVTLESAEGIGYPVADFGGYGLTERLHSPPGAEPETTCGAGISRDPIYVVDSKGRIIRTIDR